ncbi:orotidine-5'-phosphate decarboxylase [Alkalicoccus luteus]|uniref:Orotidine 5'-phosphate decarboxylase n=1 Tax=Alkalicoccus luteus TaxID=1237094 RepID=A0A969PVH9_9BACI|nr:orotidine-5'-phosphate decarboxylase [Alkalicoccus luteus]
MQRSLIVALDVENKAKAFRLLDQLGSGVYVKIGMELFYKEGLSFVDRVKHNGHGVFLDVKMHDIPETVKRAMIIVAASGIDLVNVHALGGRRMMEAAREGLEIGSDSSGRPSLIAVTQLTSTSDQQVIEEQGMTSGLERSVNQLAALTKESGLDGVVCSVHETRQIKVACGSDFLCVTPGIRSIHAAGHDQVRTATPAHAAAAGADAIVCGREITRSSDPARAYQAIQKEWLNNERV